jgi:ammonium transporter Rh
MIFIGFGFLMTFLRKHAFSSLGNTFLIGVWCIQLGTMWNTIIHCLYEEHEIHAVLNIPKLICGDFAAGAVLISYGAVLGRVDQTQIMWMLFFELIFYALNECIGVVTLGAVDMGGSMFVHTFGAYFGLAFSYMWGNPEEDQTEDESSVYHSDVFAMVGTIFLWMFWPSFNGALAPEAYYQQERVIVNTVLSLSCSCSMTFLFSHLFCHGKLDMVHIQNATLAGGVAVGTTSDLVINPFGAVIIGCIAGLLSTAGYVFLTPKMNSIGIYDVCGVHNLHGMPGVFAGLVGSIAIGATDKSDYGGNYDEIFADEPSAQAGAQFGALMITIVMSITGGLITGFLVDKIAPRRKDSLFNDQDEWEVPLKEFGDSYFIKE